MNNSKLLDLLKTFSSRDFRRFDAFLRSPYFNTDGDLVRLHDYMRALAPRFTAKKLERKFVWAKLNGKKPLDEKAFSYQMNHLLRLGEQFLGLEQYHSDPPRPEVDVLAALESRRLDKHYKSTLKRIDQALEGQPHRTERFHQMQFEVSGNAILFQSRRQARTYDRHLTEAVGHLDHYYLTARLRLTCELVNRQSILAEPYDSGQVEALLSYLGAVMASDSIRVPAVALYHQLLLLLTQPEEDRHFQHLKTLMDEYMHLVTDDERPELYATAQNFCIRRIRQGHSRYLKELFELYKTGLETGFLLEDGGLSAWKYKNIASVGLRVREFEWVEGFINDYLPLLPEEFRDTAYAYNKAFLNYSRGNLPQALRLLLQVEFNDIFFSLDTRKMMLMIYYEQDAEEPMLSLMASFRTYLRRNKLISENNRKSYNNFLNLLNAIYKASDPQAKGSRTALLSEIRATQPLVEESWLLRMAEQV